MPGQIIDDLAAGKIDVAIVWGPLAGYYVKHQSVPLEMVPVVGSGGGLPFVYDFSVGVRRKRKELVSQLDAALGRKKDEIRKILEEYGEEQFLKWRRSWDYPVPGGETLKDVYARVVPYYQREILPQLREGRNVLIAAHGNSLRALVKYLENIPDDEISKLEIGTGEVYVYQVDPQGRIVSKEIRAVNPNRGRQ